MARKPKSKKSSGSFIRLSKNLPRLQPILWFKYGMLHAAGLKIHLQPNEADGADRLKHEIRAAKLKKLPPVLP